MKNLMKAVILLAIIALMVPSLVSADSQSNKGQSSQYYYGQGQGHKDKNQWSSSQKENNHWQKGQKDKYKGNQSQIGHNQGSKGGNGKSHGQTVRPGKGIGQPSQNVAPPTPVKIVTFDELSPMRQKSILEKRKAPK
jgi:hypothetical protein